MSTTISHPTSTTLFHNSIYRLELSPNKQILHFFWEDGHTGMSYEDFQEACSNFVGYAFEYGTQNFVIDVRNFQFQLPPEFPEWQKNAHYPRYHKLGVEKVAYIMPKEYLASAKEIDKETGGFTLRNFAEPTTALQWINE